MSTKKTATQRTRPQPFQADPIWTERLRYFESRQEQIVQTIREFVEIESPSDNKPAADRMGAFLAGSFEARRRPRSRPSRRRLRRQPAD